MGMIAKISVSIHAESISRDVPDEAHSFSVMDDRVHVADQGVRTASSDPGNRFICKRLTARTENFRNSI